MKPSATDIKVVIPSRLAVNESFSIKIKVLGPIRTILSAGNYNNKKPTLHGPFNLNDSRKIQYSDNCLASWTGELNIDYDEFILEGNTKLIFDGSAQGVFPGDTRPIKEFNGYSFTQPGFHFIKVKDPESGLEALSNPVYVTEKAPESRIYWGDPHWQSFFSDGIRCPEELYAFARDEAFLDFGAISDHMEGITDRQWDYFMLVTNDYNQPGRFASLVGQEWTSMKYGHRNIYIDGDKIEPIRSDDPDFDTLDKLWSHLTGTGAILIPHHTSNVMMGCDWAHGWDSELEKAVEIYSGWGSSEIGPENGNLYPLKHCGGETTGQHVVDALNKGYRFGFIGGGDIHDGRPGEKLRQFDNDDTYKGGFGACLAASLDRKNIFESIKNHQTYATTQSRIYLDSQVDFNDDSVFCKLQTASEEGIEKAELVINGQVLKTIEANNDDPKVLNSEVEVKASSVNYAYVKVLTKKNNMAWASPRFKTDV